mmetsp:Transcript_9469/g.17479  ORF Transcript_9469/g.17479 Transcript_9469/m.17479 type:complete len:202 (-) Transcript_9469:2879-3484(-)
MAHVLLRCRLAAKPCGRLVRICSTFTSQAGAGKDRSGALASPRLSHVDETRNVPQMVDVGHKAVTRRTAQARSLLQLPKAVVDLFDSPTELRSPKGPVITTAIIAGVTAVKKTSDLIPFCHPLPLEKIDVDIQLNDEQQLVINCTVACSHKTGVEMEALTGASVAALCVYDMCKAISHDIVIQETRLVSKSGGKLDFSSSK